MKLPADLFLALRYLRPKRTFVSVITLLSILGPTLGVAILLIVSSVMAGFDRDIRNGIMNMQAHLTVYPGQEKSFKTPLKMVEALSRYRIKAAPVIETDALIQVHEQIYPKIIRGIIPELEGNVTSIQRNFFDRAYKLRDGEAVIGGRLASLTGLRQGQQFLIHSPARLTRNIRWSADGKVEVQEPDEVYLPEEVTVGNYYSMGVADFDDNIIIIHADQAAELMGLNWGEATSIQASVPDPMAMEALTRKLRQDFPDCTFVTWQEKNELLFGTLRVEKNLMTFLMAFIVLVASFSIAATLITVAVQKTREIGVLKAVGISSACIARIFLLQGGIIGVTGTSLGILLGLLVMAARNKIAALLSLVMGHEIFPAELYHLTQIPALTTPADLLRIILLSLAICVLAALVPALYASALTPAKALQEDN